VTRLLKAGTFLAASFSITAASSSGSTTARGVRTDHGESRPAPRRPLGRGPGSDRPDTHDIGPDTVGAALDAEVPDRSRLGLRSALGVVISFLLSGVLWVVVAMWLR
jgi:hypothetical protein